MSGRELRQCHYCKKNRLACMFMMIKPHKRKMCNLCQVSARKGKTHKGTKWKGYRYSETPEWRKQYKIKKEISFDKKRRLYSPLSKEQNENVYLTLSNDMWIEDYLPG